MDASTSPPLSSLPSPPENLLLRPSPPAEKTAYLPPRLLALEPIARAARGRAVRRPATLSLLRGPASTTALEMKRYSRCRRRLVASLVP